MYAKVMFTAQAIHAVGHVIEVQLSDDCWEARYAAKQSTTPDRYANTGGVKSPRRIPDNLTQPRRSQL